MSVGAQHMSAVALAKEDAAPSNQATHVHHSKVGLGERDRVRGARQAWGPGLLCSSGDGGVRWPTK
jgi:hypothetical protein